MGELSIFPLCPLACTLLSIQGYASSRTHPVFLRHRAFLNVLIQEAEQGLGSGQSTTTPLLGASRLRLLPCPRCQTAEGQHTHMCTPTHRADQGKHKNTPDVGGDVLHMGHQLSHWDTYVQIMGSFMTDFLTVFSFGEGLGMATKMGADTGHSSREGVTERNSRSREPFQQDSLCPH